MLGFVGSVIAAALGAILAWSAIRHRRSIFRALFHAIRWMFLILLGACHWGESKLAAFVAWMDKLGRRIL